MVEKYFSRVRAKLKQISRFNENTGKLALALSFGVGIGLSPFYGLHTLMSIVCGFLFKLNKVAILTTPWIVNPLTMVPIYGTGSALGAWMLGYHKTHLQNFNLGNSFMSLGELGMPLFKSFMVGNMILSILGGVLSYWIFHYIITRLRRIRKGESFK
ncbi:DUF2062 domain-containing protein [bacterium]|nr:DUF2062 domain-containing protein [bacterium]